MMGWCWQGGFTKLKIARAADARIDMEEGGRLEISGKATNCSRAKEYIEMVLSQRKGRGSRLGPVVVGYRQGLTSYLGCLQAM